MKSGRTVRTALELCVLWGWGVAAAADCPSNVREFALLAHMHMEAEGLAAYQVLQKDCAAALQQAWGDTQPRPDDMQQVLTLGRKLHAQARDQHARQASSAFSEGQIPLASADALRGLGPENAVRALGGMALDVLAAGLNSRQRISQAQTARQAADAFRGDEPRWDAAPSRGGPESMAPPQPEIALDASAVNAASCSGAYGFLAPQLRPYIDSSLADVRQAILRESVSAMLAGARQQAGSKAQTLRLLDEQVKEYNRAANEAAQTANQTDGNSDSASTAKVVSDTLELNFPCSQGPAVHASAVCAYIGYRWGSLATRASAAMVERCWEP
ncbi:hypothetical protein GmRootA79_41840 [Acidovorax sp. A79]|uniref:hypothetical protein n=1 Tax=Acidovorax sp. A79 TaxID=3056107 RepID=UPI0034E8A8B6